MKKLITQFFKFGIVGTINTVSSWIFYYSLIFLKVNYLIATTVAYFLSSIIGYILNKTWVFRKKDKSKTSMLKYYVVYISSYFLNMGCMYLFVDILNISDLLAPILVLFITVPYNFIFSRLWVFKDNKIDEEELTKLAEKHTFAICAYKESPYLEECIKSVINQKIKTNYLIATSTPNKMIEDLAEKYNIPYYVREGKSDIQDDWNFAYNNAKTELVTVAHQDDLYKSDYTKEILQNYDENILMYNTNYSPYKNGKEVIDKNSKIKEILKFFVKFKFFARFKMFRVLSLSLGNSINCPSVTYNKKLLGENVFTSELKFALDWDTFLKIARMKGISIYIPKKLVDYRIHDGATTKEFIVNNTRKQEDIIMFNKIWPKFMTKIIMKVYVKSYDTYN